MLAQLMPYLSLVREARALWEDLEGSDRDRIDKLVRKAVEVVPLPAPMEVVRTYLRDSSEPLPVRLAGAFMHPATRLTMASASETMQRMVDQEIDLDNLMRD